MVESRDLCLGRHTTTHSLSSYQITKLGRNTTITDDRNSFNPHKPISNYANGARRVFDPFTYQVLSKSNQNFCKIGCSDQRFVHDPVSDFTFFPNSVCECWINNERIGHILPTSVTHTQFLHICMCTYYIIYLRCNFYIFLWVGHFVFFLYQKIFNKTSLIKI